MPVLHFVVPPEWDQKPLSAFLRGAHQLSGTTLRAARRIEGGLTLDGAFIRTVDPVARGRDRCGVSARQRARIPALCRVVGGSGPL